MKESGDSIFLGRFPQYAGGSTTYTCVSRLGSVFSRTTAAAVNTYLLPSLKAQEREMAEEALLKCR